MGRGQGSEMLRPGRCCVELHYGTVFNVLLLLAVGLHGKVGQNSSPK